MQLIIRPCTLAQLSARKPAPDGSDRAATHRQLLARIPCGHGTSGEFTPLSVCGYTFARLLPIDTKPPMPCLSAKRRNRKNHNPKNTSTGAVQEIRSRTTVFCITRCCPGGWIHTMMERSP